MSTILFFVCSVFQFFIVFSWLPLHYLIFFYNSTFIYSVLSVSICIAFSSSYFRCCIIYTTYDSLVVLFYWFEWSQEISVPVYSFTLSTYNLYYFQYIHFEPYQTVLQQSNNLENQIGETLSH